MQRAVYILAVAVALGFGAPSAMGATVEAHGQCQDDGDGGSGSVAASTDDPTNPDAVDAAEVESVADALAAFGTGQAQETSGMEDDGEACDNPDDDNGNGVEEPGEEDHVAASVSAQGESAGVCFDNDGDQLHTTSECHDTEH